MQTWSSKAQHSGLNKAHFFKYCNWEIPGEKKKKKGFTHFEKSIQDTKLKSKGCSPKSRQTINMDLPLVFQRHLVHLSEVGIVSMWQVAEGEDQLLVPGMSLLPWDSSEHTRARQALGLVPSQYFSSSSYNTVSSSSSFQLSGISGGF